MILAGELLVALWAALVNMSMAHAMDLSGIFDSHPTIGDYSMFEFRDGKTHDISFGAQAGQAFGYNQKRYGISSFLWYKSTVGDPRDYMDGLFYDFPNLIQQQKVLIQLSLDLTFGKNAQGTKTPLQEVYDELKDHASQGFQQTVTWADYLAGMTDNQGNKLKMYLRPFAEMNDRAETWEVGYLPIWGAAHGWTTAQIEKARQDWPREFSQVWALLVDIFKARGATNCYFLFEVMAVDWSSAIKSPDADFGNPNDAHKSNSQLVFEALKLIPPGDIGGFGIHPYTRANLDPAKLPKDQQMYLGRPTPFKFLVEPWLKRLALTAHRDVPLVIGEMGVSYFPEKRGIPSFPAQPKDPSRENDLSPADLVDMAKNDWRNNHAAERLAWEKKRAFWLCQAFDYARTPNPYTRRKFSLMTYFNNPQILDLSKDWSIDVPVGDNDVADAELKAQTTKGLDSNDDSNCEAKYGK